MCCRAAARSVAAMRPFLVPLTAAAAATAAVLAATPAAHAADAVYGGTTTDGDAIVVTADAAATKLRSIAISWRATCGPEPGNWIPGGGVLTPAEPVAGFAPGADELLVSKNAKGVFAGTQLAGGAGPMVADLTGKLKPGKATGTLSVTVKLLDPETGATAASCQTNQRWTATRNPGIIYGGATSQDQPVVVRLNQPRKRVNDVITTWFANCTPEGVFRAPDHFGNFPVKGSGAFGNPFDWDTNLPDGGKRHYAYQFKGRLTSKAVKGTLQVKVNETDAAGAPGAGCDTGGMTFKAATG
jgi:hypothetical protein